MLQPELVYSGQGAKLDGGSAQVNYLNIPVLGKYMLSDEFSVLAGPQLGILLNSKLKADSGESVDTTDDSRKIDFAFDLGLGYKINSNIGVDLRYNLGLTDINKVTESGAKTFKNSVLQLGVNYTF